MARGQAAAQVRAGARPASLIGCLVLCWQWPESQLGPGWRSCTHPPHPCARPQPLAEGEEQAGPPPPVPLTFRLLDEGLPLLHVPVAAREPRLTFLKPIPKIGAYLAAALRTPGGEYQSVLAAGETSAHPLPCQLCQLCDRAACYQLWLAS